MSFLQQVERQLWSCTLNLSGKIVARAPLCGLVDGRPADTRPSWIMFARLRLRSYRSNQNSIGLLFSQRFQTRYRSLLRALAVTTRIASKSASAAA